MGNLCKEIFRYVDDNEAVRVGFRIMFGNGANNIGVEGRMFL